MIIKDGKEALGRLITIPRNEGDNNSLKSLLKRVGFDSPNEYCIVGPKIEDFSSTEVRKALESRDTERLRTMVHPPVADKLLDLENSKWVRTVVGLSM